VYRALTTVKADLAQNEFGITGRGIVWAVIATGVDGEHPHFRAHRNLELPEGLHHMDFSTLDTEMRAAVRHAIYKGTTDFDSMELPIVSAPVDPNGHGTAVAGIIAGESTDDDGRPRKGVAPEATILSFNVLDDEGHGSEVNVLAALLAVQHMNRSGESLKIHGVVVPLELEWDVANFACGRSPICAEMDRLVNSGVVAVAPAGNRGFAFESKRTQESGIRDPGNAELAITVGATHRLAPEVYGPSYFSSRGPTADGRLKPDLLAPGEKISVCGAGAQRDYWPVRDGTSYAAGYVSGAAAAMLSARSELIGRPQEVKATLLRTAVDLGREPMYQGAGLVDVLAAVRDAAGDEERRESAKERRTRIQVFCSYSHKDKALLEELRAHLSPLERAEVIEVWTDGLIEAGQEWEEEIYAKLEAADVVLLLVSAYFVASDFCYSKELKRALDRARQEQTRVIPIRVRPVALGGTPLEGIQALPPEAKPITSYGDPHEGWAEVSEHLREIVVALQERQAQIPSG
jgi:hypothetical protein